MKAKPKIKDSFVRSLRPLLIQTDGRLPKLILAVIIFIIIYALLAVVIIPARVTLELERPSTKTIYAPRDVVDEYTTERLRKEAADAVPEVYDYDPAVLEKALAEVERFFDTVRELAADAETEVAEKMEVLQESFQLEELPESSVASLFGTEQAIIDDLEERLSVLLADVMEQGIKAGEADASRRAINREISTFPFGPNLQRVAEALVNPLVVPNKKFNPEATAQNREAARQSVEPVVILRGTLIISEGETVTEKHIAQLESLGLIRGAHVDYAAFIGLFLFLLILFVLVGIYLFIFVKNVYNTIPLLILLGLVVVLTLLFAIAATYFSGYLIPVAMGVILIAVMFGARLAVMMNVVFALLVGLITGGDFTYFVVALLGGMASIYAVSRVSQRGDLAKAGLYVAGTNTVAIIATFLLLGNLSLEYAVLREVSYGLLAGLGNGLLSSVVAIGLLPYLESGFGLTTAITLLELSNPNQPLLRELLMKAPGTYYHSMMVGNLSEAAAERVNADPLLTRVGAYYHDIGKLKRPYFFSENQLSGENPHDKISPNLSALIIGAHPKDGVELGRKYRLPAVILNIISQHHGTSLISFFYQKALEKEGRDYVSIDKFRYEGPLPQSKEAAIIMLADAIEAGARSLSKPTSTRIEGLIRRIIKEKLNDGQMDECDLTLKELDQIGDAFVYIMSGIYHSRVEYPEKDLKDEFERSSNTR